MTMVAFSLQVGAVKREIGSVARLDNETRLTMTAMTEELLEKKMRLDALQHRTLQASKKLGAETRSSTQKWQMAEEAEKLLIEMTKRHKEALKTAHSVKNELFKHKEKLGGLTTRRNTLTSQLSSLEAATKMAQVRLFA